MSQQITIPGPGDLLAERYRIIEELGRGSYGVVFKAVEEQSARVVAIKTLLPQSVLDKEVIERFEREAQLVSRLQHINIISLHDYGQRDNLFYMVMEFIEGRSLDDLLEQDAPLAPDRAQDLLVQIMEALEHAHARGIVHRDLKPDNILLQPTTSGREIVKVLDFGIAKALRDENQDMKTLTQAGHVLGTPHYMSPEQIAGDEVDHRSDLYALGVITYELLVGEHPFEGTSPTAVMVAHLRDDPPALPDHLERSKWGTIVREAMRKQPDDRIAGAKQFLGLLQGNHDLIDADESNEVTALFTPSSLTEADADQGATREMEPLTHLYSPAQLAAGAPASADATMQWQRKELPPEPDFGAQPLYPSTPPLSQPRRTVSPGAPPEVIMPGFPALADPAPTMPGHSTQPVGGKRALVWLVVLLALLFVGMTVYAFWPATPPSGGVVPPGDLIEDASPDTGEEAALVTTPRDTVDMVLDAAPGLDMGMGGDVGLDMPVEHVDMKASDQGLAAPTQPPKKQPPSMISFKITSDPANARVRIENREIGNTPLTHRIKQGDKTVSISVSRHGFTPQTRSIKTNKTRSIHFSLEPEMMLSP